ncbi:O-antigen ligase family protein [uncultured Gemmiger sp.]|uniref:O-antigen ligase family protein n=1 Tax=uncultured Gemmiger sp. TaxID=1623490 RepID=UPI0025E3C603|nr:O-antigen ligase family protein [uncultured Gemmiger sp.]
MGNEPLRRLTAGCALSLCAATLCVFPLYVDKFSNLGVTKFTGVFLLLLLWCLALGASALIGARAVPGRLAARRGDLTLWGLAGFAAATVLATFLSLKPLWSTWGIGSYYGGMMLVLITAAGYLAVRAFAPDRGWDYLAGFTGVTVSVVTVLYVLNIFNIDLIGTYADTAVVERAQFFSTLGQKDFNAGYLSVALPLVFYAYLTAKGRLRTLLYGIPACFGALALAVVDAEGLTLGIGTAMMVLACHRDFDTRKMRRGAVVGVMFFAWAAWMHWMRRSVYTQGGTSLLAKFGEIRLALPLGLACLAIWAVLAWRACRGRPEVSLCLLGRVLTVLLLAAGAGLFLLANLWPGFPSLGSLDNLLVFNDDWGTYRGTAWRIAWQTWANAPLWRKLVGFGPGMMHQAVAAWAGTELTPRMGTFYAAHNEFLEQLLSTGILGLAGWLVFVVSHLRRGFARWADARVAPVLLALCSYLAQSVVSIRVSMVFPEVMLLFALLAAWTAPVPQPAPAAPAPRGKKGRKKAAADPAAAPRRTCLIVTAAAVVSMALAAVLSRLFFSTWF